MSAPTCQLYLLTPPALDPDSFADELRAALGAAEVPALQIRLKDVDDETIRRAVEALQPVAHEHDTAVILNDRPDLAAELGCDGVHVGRDDMPYAEARRIMGAERIVGVTCHDSRDLAYELAEAGADYVAFGAFFETATKQPKSRAPLDLLADWSLTTTVPCVAIGGITVENCVPLIEAGADFIAVSGGVWNHPDGPAAAIARFAGLFREHHALNA